MKHVKYFLFIAMFFAFKLSVAQNDYEVRVGGFGNGDMASVDDLLKYPSLTVISRNASGNIKKLSYNCVFVSKNSGGSIATLNDSFAFNSETIALLSKSLGGDEIVVKDLRLEVADIKTGAIGIVNLDPITIKISTKLEIVSPPVSSAPKVDYGGKLISGKNRDQPVVNQKVVLQDHQNIDIQTTTTDIYGDFNFTELNSEKTYKVNVLLTADSKIKDGQLFIAKADGTIISAFNKTKNGYVYELLPMELTKLITEKEEDTELKIKNFGTSKEAALTVVENIYYDPNSAEIKKESFPKLDNIITAMAQNKNLKLSINSFTDSNGDDSYNLKLSQKRAQKVMDYFILKGIGKNRLKAKGFGETQIKNRCKNGIDCSETEHMLNRRTEFIFTK